MAEGKTFPVQVQNLRDRTGRAPSPRIPECVHMKAYEVYCKVFSPQKALTEGEGRGGFGMTELIGFLYASGFPEEEWRARCDEAWEGMKKQGWG